MTRNEFELLMEDLIDVFGPLKYSSRRKDVMFEVLQDVEQEDMKNVVTRAIGTQSQAPLLEYFETALKSELEKIHKKKREKILKEADNCLRCNNTGRFSTEEITKRSYTMSYSWRCSCPFGDDYKSHPRWEDGNFDSNIIRKKYNDVDRDFV